MKLIHNCVRDVMLYLEENLDLFDTIVDNEIKLSKYDIKDIKYTLLKIEEAGFIRLGKTDLLGNIYVKDITYKGHQFLDTVKDNKIWKKTLTKISKFASVSIPIIQELASQILSMELGLHQ